MDPLHFNSALSAEIDKMCSIALSEDLDLPNGSDITAELIPTQTQATATLITREDTVVCGVNWVNRIFQLVGNGVEINWAVSDGTVISAGSKLCDLSGNARQILTGERSAMNFLQSLSATATVTNQYVSLIEDSNCKLLDTRKTIPGMRYGQKYAVQCGGGVNHRIGLSDAYLIKENHIMACGGILAALSKAKNLHSDKLVEIEVESISELHLAIEGEADVIMLDNFNLDQLKQARALVDSLAPSIKLEASGNVNKQTIANIASTGVDFISVGALTKDIKAIDLSLRINLTD